MKTTRPLLLIDVDGPLNPYAAQRERRPEGYITHRMRPSGRCDAEPLRMWLEYVERKHLAAALLLHVDPRIGLIRPDFDALAEWAAAL